MFILSLNVSLMQFIYDEKYHYKNFINFTKF